MPLLKDVKIMKLLRLNISLWFKVWLSLFIFTLVLLSVKSEELLRAPSYFSYLTRLSVLYSAAESSEIAIDHFECADSCIYDEDIIDEAVRIISSDDLAYSQRMIIGLSKDASFDYLMWRVFGFRLGFADNDFQEKVFLKLSSYYPIAFGGVDLRPATLSSFNSFEELNGYIRNIRSKLTKRKEFVYGNVRYQAVVEPMFYMDWTYEDEGLNYKIFNSYLESETKSPLNVIRADIDGIFGPDLDFAAWKVDEFANYLTARDKLSQNGIVSFAKHFGYRPDFRKSEDGVIPDTHKAAVMQTTPLELFIKEDLALYESFLSPGPPRGLMVGHHVLQALDPVYPATASFKVKDFITEKLGSDVVTVSDSLDMKSVRSSFEGDNIFNVVTSDLTLLTLLSFPADFEVIDVGQQNDAVKKILELKHRLGKFHVVKVSD